MVVQIDTSAASGPTLSILVQAERAAGTAARNAGVTIGALVSVDDLRPASELLASVWGRSPEGVPMNSEVMRSLVHADGLVSGAYNATGDLVGVSVLGRGRPGAGYSYLAGIKPGGADAGIGFALKQHQRSWALARDIRVIEWTFDPLVSRNARFNVSKLGAVVREYEPSFYGQMSDDINGTDASDRLVATWEIGDARAIAASEGTPADTPDAPPIDGSDSAVDGPDGASAWIASGENIWCRVPTDIVAVRKNAPALASAWRAQIRQWLTPALAHGYVVVSVSRTGWYHLVKENR